MVYWRGEQKRITSGMGEGLLESCPLTHAERGRDLVLSTNQLAGWFHPLRFPEAPAYYWHLPMGIRIHGEFDGGLFERCVAGIVARQEATRTVYVERWLREPLQRVVDAGPISLPVSDFEALPAAEREAAANRLLRETLTRPFDLTQAPPWRLVLARLGPREHLFFAALHHIVADAWSQAIFIRELAALYQAGAAADALPALTWRYADFAVWQRRRLELGEFDGKIDYWCRQLTPWPKPLELPLDYPRPAIRGFRGQVVRFTITPDQRRRVEACGRRHGATLFSVLLAGFYLLLHKLTRQTDLLVGVPVANRPQREFRNVMGCFAKNLPIRLDMAGGGTFAQLLGKVHTLTREGLAHQEAPMLKVFERLKVADRAAQEVLTQLVFIYQSALTPRVELPGTTFDLELKWDLLEMAREEMIWQVQEGPSGLDVCVEYREDLFRRDRILTITGDYVRLLDQAQDHPETPLAHFALTTGAN